MYLYVSTSARLRTVTQMRLPRSSLVLMVYDWRHFNRSHWTLTARRNWATSNTRHVIPLNVPKYAIWIVPTANTLSCRKRSQTRHLSRERSQTRHLCRNTTFWRDHHLCGRLNRNFMIWVERWSWSRFDQLFQQTLIQRGGVVELNRYAMGP